MPPESMPPPSSPARRAFFRRRREFGALKVDHFQEHVIKTYFCSCRRKTQTARLPPAFCPASVPPLLQRLSFA
jgi:hypothetical protein